MSTVCKNDARSRVWFFILAVIMTVFVLFSVSFINTTLATSEADIVYPIAELGNCPDKEACFEYCDDLSHKDACLAFAERHNLIPKEDLEIARKVPGVGPGGCQSHDACEQYCADPAHSDECLAFAERHGLIPPEELEIARVVLKDGGPGGCRTREQCEQFCSQEANFETCFEFAKKHGLIKPEDEEIARKLGGRQGPGGCRGFECRTYCDSPDHFDECIKFAEENGLIDPEEATHARKLGNKPGPGGCIREQCRDYCEKPENMDICIQFARENGFMSEEEAERALKFRNLSGPGGCRGEECKTFCENPEHQEECFKFAKDNGLIPPEDLGRMEAEKTRFAEELEKFPAEVKRCLEEKLGPVLEQIKSGDFGFNPRLGEAIRACFEQFQPPEGQFPPGGEHQGPPPPHQEFTPPPSNFGAEQNSREYEARCREAGGVWDAEGKYCRKPDSSYPSPEPTHQFTPPPEYTNPPEYSPTPGTENYYQQPDPATECAKRGGAWDPGSSTCRIPEQSSSLLLRAAAFISKSFSGFFGF